MKKISRINKTQEFKFSYKDLIQRSPLGAGQGLVLFFGGLLAKSAWALHQEASLVAGGALAAHKIQSSHALAASEQQLSQDDQVAPGSHADVVIATSELPLAVEQVDTQTHNVQIAEGAFDSVDGADLQLAALDTVPKDSVAAKPEIPTLQLTVDLSDMTLGTPGHLPTVQAPVMPEFVAPSPAFAIEGEGPESYLKWLGLMVGGGTVGAWADFAAGVVSSSSTIGGYAIDGAVYNSVVYRYDSAKSASNYTDIFGDGSVYDYVWGGSAGVRYTTSAGAYYALPTSGGTGGAIKVMASTSSYDMGWDSSKTYGFNTPLIMSSPYDTGTGQVVNPFTTLIQGLIDNDSTLSVATAASRVSTAFGLSSYYSSLGITSASELLYFNPLDYTSSSTAATKAAAIAMQAKAIEIVATISGGTQAVLAQNSNMDEVSVTKAVLSSLVSYVGTNYASGVDLSSSTVVDSVLSSVTADNSSGTSTTVYLTDQALSTIASANSYVSSATTLANAYSAQLQVMKNTDYSDAAFKAISKLVSDAVNGDTILSISFTSTSVGKTNDNMMQSVVADPTFKLDLSSVSYTSGDSLVISDLTNTYEYTLTTAELKAGITAGYITFNLSDLESSGVSLSLSESETFVMKAYLNKSGSTVDGSGYLAFMQNTTGNNIAYISGTPTGSAIEDSSTTASGTLTVTDADSGEAVLIAQSSVAGVNGYGSFTVTAAGAWTYTLSTTNATIQALGAGVTTTDTLTVYSADGTDSQKITVTITGTNDAAVISGTTTYSLTETNAVLTTSGTLTSTDVDGTANLFTAETVSGTYGSLTMLTTGAWTYTAASAYDSLTSGTVVTDTFTVHAADGTSSSITVNITGTNDAATISGTSTYSLTETNAVLTTSGTLTSTDVDGTANLFTAETVSGTYGSLTMLTTGAWTYTASSEHDAFVKDTVYTDTFAVHADDGTTQTVTVSIVGTNDSATIDGDTTGSITDYNTASQSTTGTLTSTDVDGTANLFTAETAAGTYGSFVLATDGSWTYSMTAAQDFDAGSNHTDSFTAYAADGTAQTVTLTIKTPGVASATLTETDVAQSVTGTLSSATYVAQTSAAGSNGYGKFNLGTDGAWTYTMDSAQNAFASGTAYTDTLTATDSDGNATTITVTITGTNDSATIAGTSTAALTQADAAQTATGTLTITDVDSSATFVAQTNVAGTNGYGTFSVTTGGVWTYTMNTAHTEFVSGTKYTDSLIVASADGTTKTVTVTMTGINDAATFGGATTGILTETNAAQTTTGTLTVTDVDSTATFVAQTLVAGSNGYGKFSVTTAGVWTYTMNSAQNAFVEGTTYTDTLTVKSLDGSSQVVTVSIAGSNDAAVISGTSTYSLTETNEVLTTSGTLTSTDVDGTANLFTAEIVTGSYGSLTMLTTGAWTYTASSANDSFVKSTVYSDTFTVHAGDGTASTITVNITGTNDAAVISGTSTYSLTETDAVLTTSGTLTSTDVDGTANLFTSEPVSGTYGSLVMATSGTWTYTAKSTYNYLVAGAVVTDTFTVHAADGTASSVTVSITGTNDTPVLASSTASITLDQGATSQTIATVSATDVDLVGSLTYSISRQNGDASADYFTVNASTGVVTFTSAGAIATAVDATDTNSDGVMDTPYVIHVIATDDKGAYATETITVNVDMAVSSSGLSASLPGTTSNWSFAPQTTTSGDSTVSDGFKMTSTTSSSVYINLPSTVTSLSFAADATNTLTLANDATTGTVTDTSTSNHNFTVTSGVTENILLQVKAASTQTITGVTDTTVDPDLGTSTNYRDDTVLISDAAFTDSSFSISGDNLLVTMSSSGAVKTLSEIESVMFNDGNTVRVVGADGYSSFLEAINLQSYTSVTGTLSSATYVAQTAATGDNGYGTFTLGTDGAWTYSMESAQSGFVSGTEYTDTLTATDSDGNETSITVTITGATYSTTDLAPSTATIVNGVVSISALGATSYAADGDYIYYGATDTFYSYVDDTASTGNTISVSSTTTVDKFIKVLDASTQTITGVSDTSTSLGTNYRDDTVLISDAAFTDAKFSMSGTSLKITTDNSVKTLSEVESVMFNDGTTVRVVGASGYASFLEAINQGNTSHAAVNDYVYGSSSSGYTPTAADLTHLTAVSGHTDFYTYNG